MVMVMVMVVESEDGRHGGRSVLENLPEGCMANVISFTTPRDACTLSMVSSTFRSAAQSDVVWDRFLPSDYHSIISQSSLPHASKKDLYRHLCQIPLLFDSGEKSFILDKVSGKKCYMLHARSLFIVWGDTPRYWRWSYVPECRLAEVAELLSVCWFEIRGKMKMSMLSPETLYGAYLVFKHGGGGAYGFDYQPVEVSVGIVGESEARKRTVYLDAERPRRPPHRIVRRRFGMANRNCPRTRLRSRFCFLDSFDHAVAPSPAPPPESVDHCTRGIEFPKERGGGWLEIELGEFFNKGGEDKEVEMGVYEVNSGNWKGGLILQGIELRPKHDNN